MAQVAIHEAKKVLRRELKKRIAGMSDELKQKESTSIVKKVPASTCKRSSCVNDKETCMYVLSDRRDGSQLITDSFS